MLFGKTVIISALAVLLAAPLVPTPAEAQSPGRVLGPITAPLRMILRGVPRARPAPRAYRSRANRATAAERTRGRRQAAQVAAAAAGAGTAAFWPIGAPDAFEDMLGYALWPREYGAQFWSHGPGDIMRAMTAPTSAFAADASERPTRQRLAGAVIPSANAAAADRAICIARVKDQAMRPLDRIDQTVTLTKQQQQSLETLRTAVRAAIDGEAAACRGDLPASQPERLRAMIDGLWAMRYAEFRIRPALETFYGALTDAQKTQLAEAPQTVGGNESAPAPTPAAICSAPASADGNPFEAMQRALQPTPEQRQSVQMLYGASMEMAQFLNGTCPIETPDSPITRLGAASDRVMSLLHAAMNIEPILGGFYASLSDQQRRRFNAALR